MERRKTAEIEAAVIAMQDQLKRDFDEKTEDTTGKWKIRGAE